ncbi:MAG TPA: acyltransferase [Acetobacteraceae bacterium]|nr:acyltransferase [Acetobacteraceae bacterium]
MSPPRKIESVQALRAVAALSVAILHVLHDAIGLDPGGLMARWHDALPWAAGVDLFFVISGFVMVYASADLFGRRDSPARFTARRLIRIVPLYWAATTLFLVMALASPGSVSDAIGGISDVVQSYAFIPARRPDGNIQPIYSLGWTLNYEMFFYVVFAACIWLSCLRAVALVALLLGGAMAVHRLVPDHAAALVFWTAPLMAEFLFGMVVALLATTRLSLTAPVRAALLLSALLLLMLAHRLGLDGNAPLAVGLPMALLLATAVLGTPVPISRTWLLLGDASYALYLVHPFAMRAASLLWLRLHLAGPVAAATYAATALALAIIAAVCVHLWFERPVTRWLRAATPSPRQTRGRAPGGAAAPS